MKETDLLCVEGEKSVLEILQNPRIVLREMYATAEWANKVLASKGVHPSSIPLNIISENALQRISSQKNPYGVLAIIDKRFSVENRNSKWILALDCVQDPGNMGTIIRTCDWFGIDTIVCSHETAYHFNQKVIQSAMGSLFRINVHYVNLMEWLRKQPLPVIASSLEGSNMYTTTLPQQGILVLGNESKGISQAILDHAHLHIKIPSQNSKAESLNISVACGVILAHVTMPTNGQSNKC